MLKGYLHIGPLCSALILYIRAGRPGIDLLWRLLPGIFQYAALDAASPQVLVDRIRAGIGYIDRDTMLSSISYLVVTRHAPLTHGRNNFQVRRKRVDRDIEAHLVIALTCTAMGHSHRAFRVGHLDQQPWNQWTCQGRRQGILPLVDRPSLQSGPHKVAHKISTPIDDQAFDRANLLSACSNRRQITIIAYIDGQRNNVQVILFINPTDGYRGI